MTRARISKPKPSPAEDMTMAMQACQKFIIDYLMDGANTIPIKGGEYEDIMDGVVKAMTNAFAAGFSHGRKRL